jgi:RNA 2',3'-cyclic 3'-phosphodiesterase
VTRRSSDERRARLFLALDLPDSTRETLVAWREQALAGRTDLRPVAAEALHVTLVFLGHRPEGEIERVASVAFEAVRVMAAPRFAATELRGLPPRAPRLFALSLSDEGDRAAVLHWAASDALAAAGLYTPEKRPFWPHLTFARVKKGESRPPALEGPPPPSDPFISPQITLYRSLLRPQGALYEPQQRLRLA